MAEPRLHYLERQFESTIDAAVDAPGGVEVPQCMQALVFCTAMLIDDAGGNLRRMEAAADDVVAVVDAAPVIGEHEAKLAPGRGQPVFAQCGNQHWRERDGALARLRLRPPDLAIAIGALAHMQIAAFQVDIIPPQASQLGGAQSGKKASFP